jgi:hypothetical protein
MPFNFIPRYTSSLPSPGPAAVPEKYARFGLEMGPLFYGCLYFCHYRKIGQLNQTESAIVFVN